MNGLTCMSFQNTDRGENSTERNSLENCSLKAVRICVWGFFFFSPFSSLYKLCAAEESFHRLRKIIRSFKSAWKIRLPPFPPPQANISHTYSAQGCLSPDKIISINTRRSTCTSQKEHYWTFTERVKERAYQSFSMQKTCASIWLWVKKSSIELAMQMCFTLCVWKVFQTSFL